MFDVILFDNLAAPFNCGNNNYSCFDSLDDRYGVYVFQEKNTGEVLYIGQAYQQDLKMRISQNYTENDTGGTFRKNWCSDNNAHFYDFKNALNYWVIKTILIPVVSKDSIREIEACLIKILNPKYNINS